MANTLTAIIPSVIRAMQSVSRSTGALFNAINTDVGADQVGKGQAITLPINGSISATDVTPGPTPPAFVDQTLTSNTLTLSEQKAGKFHLTSEERAKISANAEYVPRGIEQAIKAVVNAANDYAYQIAYQGAGYAFGTAGTTPFASNPDILLDVWKSLMDDDYAPNEDLWGIVSTAAWAAAGKLDQFQKANEAPAGVDFSRNSIGMLSNFMMGFDQRLTQVTAGTGASYLVNGAASEGDSTVTVDTGSGTILAGDIITFAADTTNKYVATSFAGNVITLNRPLLADIPDNNAVTVAAASVRNIFCHKDAIRMGFRPSASDELDVADDATVVTDPVSGLSLRLALYKGYHGGQYEVSAVYGGVVDRKAWLRVLLG